MAHNKRTRSKRTQEQIEAKTREKRYSQIGNKKVEDQLEEVKLQPSGLETIDRAMWNLVNVDLDLYLDSNEGFKKVPVLWTTAERAFQVKDNKDLRDKSGALVLPLITIARTGINKEPDRRGLPYANLYPVPDSKDGTITIARHINQEKTARYQNAQAGKTYGPKGLVRGRRYNVNKRDQSSQRIVYNTITIPLPTWVTVTYEIALRTEYQKQMNELIRPFFTIAGNSRMPKRINALGHFYEVFIDGSFADNSNQTNLGMEQRNYETMVTVEVLGYLIGKGENHETPSIVTRENAVEFRIGRERSILGDIPDTIKDGAYRDENTSRSSASPGSDLAPDGRDRSSASPRSDLAPDGRDHSGPSSNKC